MATPTVREVLSNSASGGGTVAVTTGAGTLSTDVLYTFWVDDFDTAAGMLQPSPGTWVSEATGDKGSNLPHMKLFSRQVGGAGGATSVTVTDPGSASEVYQITYVVAGVGTVDDGGAASAINVGNSTTIACPSVTPVGTDDLLLCAYYSFPNVAVWTVPPGMTNQITEGAAGFGSLASARQVLSSAGATGTRTATANATQSHLIGISIAIGGTGGAAATSTPMINKRAIRNLVAR